MKQWFVVILLVAVSVLTSACGLVTAAGEAENNPAAVLPAYETQSNSENAVMVEVTPLNLADGGTSLDFDVAFNTHSVALDFDPAAISILRDDQGREYPALGWDGDGPGGHHRSGTLRFKVPDYATTSVEVVLKGVSGVPERTFHWNLMGS